MPRSLNPRNKRLPPLNVTEDEDREIRKRAEEAFMTVAEYMRERSLGKECPPVAKPKPKKGKA